MTTRELAGTVMETFGWLFVGGAGCLAWNEYVTLHSHEFLSGPFMEDFAWKTVITLAVAGLALTIWGRKLRSKLSAAAFGIAGASFLLCYAVLAVSEYQTERSNRSEVLSVACDAFGWHVIITLALVGLSLLTLAWVAHVIANGRN